MAVRGMSEGSRKVLGALQANPGIEFKAGDLAGLAGVTVSTVTGCVNSLVKKGYAMRRADTIEQDGKAKEIKYISITQEGVSYDPDAVEIAE